MCNELTSIFSLDLDVAYSTDTPSVTHFTGDSRHLTLILKYYCLTHSIVCKVIDLCLGELHRKKVICIKSVEKLSGAQLVTHHNVTNEFPPPHCDYPP